LTESRLSILVHYSSKKNPTGFGTKFDWKIWVHAFHALKTEPDTGSKTMKTSTKSKMEHSLPYEMPFHAAKMTTFSDQHLISVIFRLDQTNMLVLFSIDPEFSEFLFN
jgi:hypothetical protein